MREQCKHFQSRTYDSGEVVRFCELDLAPEAPWRCPDACGSFEARLADVGWVHGTLVEPPIEDEPTSGPEVVRLLEEAEDIIDAVVPETVAEVRREEQRTARAAGTRERRRWPWRRR